MGDGRRIFILQIPKPPNPNRPAAESSLSTTDRIVFGINLLYSVQVRIGCATDSTSSL